MPRDLTQRPNRHKHDMFSDVQIPEEKEHPLDSDESKQELSRILAWFYAEREKQSANRLEMAMDADFYDNDQWAAEDKAIVESRGQMALVYNEIAPMVDWLIGTERRTRVDWSILPRAEDDVEMASIKEKVLKYVSDVNRVPFARSRAFADAVKVGVGWMDDGARDDPTQDVLYSKYEDWRCVLWDSASYELDLSDARFVFRWRWVDEDIALAMFPERAEQIRLSTEDTSRTGEDDWFLGEHVKTGRSGVLYTGNNRNADTTRRRIRLIECQYKKPVAQKIISDGALCGAFFNESDAAMVQAVENGASIEDRVVMRVHFAVFTEAALLSMGESTYRHNRFSLTPIWCYRRNRDRMPYGVIRRVRDIQQDLNKRASKALFLLNTNQVIADVDAVEDWNHAREEVARPDGTIIKKKGYDFTIRRDTEASNGQITMMTLAAQSIQKTSGVNNENLGRTTNAVSGIAIEARQQQGAVSTTEPFDNLRYAVQIQGEKQLSLTEQFYSEQKVIRLIGGKNKIEWVKINTPEEQTDGSMRWLNDITASMGDFVVSEQDYAGTARIAMFESLNQIAARLPPDISVRLLQIAFEFSDMPNKDEIVQAIRVATGQQNPNQEPTPEEQQQQAEQMQIQAEAMEMQRKSALVALEEQQAKVREINARAQKIEAEINTEGGSSSFNMQLMAVKAQAALEIDNLSDKLRQSQSVAQAEIASIRRESDARLEVARIEAESRVRVAEIQVENNVALARANERLKTIEENQKGGVK